MYFENSAKRLSHEILVRIVAAVRDNRLRETIDRIPIDLRSLDSSTSRCCVYKSRALIKYRVMAFLGFGVEDEEDELTSLSEYAERALNRTRAGNQVLSIIDPACAGCPKPHFYISDVCRGCMARPCIMNCPKKCISQAEGRAHIDTAKCIMCGRCQRVCPYNAVVRVSVPCEEVCPVAAINKNGQKNTRIDFLKCIYCGKCVDVCPFGAITECSQVMDVLSALRSGKVVYALPAPAIVGQFEGGLERIAAALVKVGFHDMLEVAHGADVVCGMEAREFLKKKQEGLRFMTTSCCPAYVQAAAKSIPAILPHISATPSPLQITAKQLKFQNSQAIAVFIGPCVAKRKEALDHTEVDYYLTFAELAAVFDAHGVKVEDQECRKLSNPARKKGRGFAAAGGVLSAISGHWPISPAITTETINGLTKSSLKQLDAYAKGEKSADLIEVMNCNGGCINGPDTIVPPVEAKKILESLVSESQEMSIDFSQGNGGDDMEWGDADGAAFGEKPL